MDQIDQPSLLDDPATLHSLEFLQLRSLLAELTQTPMGRELALELSPSTDYPAISRNLDLVSEYLEMRALKGGLRFEGVIDLAGHLKELAAPGSILPAEEIQDIYNLLVAVQSLHGFIKKREQSLPLLTELIEQTDSLASVRTLIEATITPYAEIRDDASPELKRIRSSIQKNRERIYRSLERYCARPEIAPLVQDNVITQRNQRFVIPIKVDGKSKVKGIIHDQSSSGATIFIEPLSILPLNNVFLQDKLAEEKEIKRLLRLIADRCRHHIEVLKINVSILGHLDLVQAKGLFAIQYQASRPALTSKDSLEIYAARHPLLIHYLGQDKVVPIDIVVNEDTRLLLITGPNMGGKTVALKTAGLLALMVQSGLFVPASARSTFPVFQAIFTDIGDLQDLSQSLSTFASHLVRIKTILEAAVETSLVLIDELGTGTDPDEGSALGQMVLDEMFNRKAITIATTHLSLLKQRTFQKSETMVASVQFDNATAQPTFRLKYGQFAGSNAFTIAQNLGVPPRFIDKARKLLDPLQVRLDELAKMLEQKQRDIERTERNLAQKQQHLDKMKQSAEKKAQDIIIEAQHKGAALLEQVRERVRHLHAELASQKTDHKQVEKLSAHLTDISHEIEQIRPQPPPPVSQPKVEIPVVPRQLAKGDRVELEQIKAVGTIDEIIEARNEAIVNLAGKMTKVPLATLKFVASQPAQHIDASISVEKNTDLGTVPIKISLLGERVDEALRRLDHYVHDALMYGHHQVFIIHGIGQEKLRPAIHEFLEDNPLVKKFRPGDRHEGGFGVTVVDLIVE